MQILLNNPEVSFEFLNKGLRKCINHYILRYLLTQHIQIQLPILHTLDMRNSFHSGFIRKGNLHIEGHFQKKD
jgi:hypothetical protein